MFHTYVFTEMPYPYLPPAELMPNNRVSVPNSFYDPDAGYELYRKYYDIYAAADELGLDVMVNEHHTTATCTNAVTPLSMAILARETKRARILTLGNPVAYRPDPVRIAEEMATVDVISGGRADVGFVRGVPQESIAVNATAIDMRERMWEAIDLIMKAFTTHDGPFSWEGKHFQHREVNLWPRPYQTPHPPIWSPTLNPASAAQLAERDMTVATLSVGTAWLRARSSRPTATAPPSSGDRRAAAVEVRLLGAHVRRRHRRGSLPRSREGEALVQGGGAAQLPVRRPTRLPAAGDPRQSAQVAGRRARSRRRRWGRRRRRPWREIIDIPARDLIDRGYIMAGNPDTVFEQMRDFFDAVGGLGQPAADGAVLDDVLRPRREEHGAARATRSFRASSPRSTSRPYAANVRSATPRGRQ